MSTSTLKGMTLVEMLVVISVSTVIMLMLNNTINTFYRNNIYTINQAYEVDNARRGLELTIRDLREMTYGDDGAYPLVSAGTSSISFYSDIDRDYSVELVTYTLSTTTITKRVTNATGTPPTYTPSASDETAVISQYVRNMAMGTSTFRYFDEDGAPVSTTTVTDIRYVGVTIIVNIDPSRDPNEFTLYSTTALRNLKTTF